MTFAQGRMMHDFILEHRLRRCLELGFYHGVSSAYIAGALQEIDTGHLTTIDIPQALTLSPNINEVLKELQLQDLVTVFIEPRSYTWRLMRFLEAGMYGEFDFCYIDGGHTWDTTGFALSLVAHLLRPGGWVVLDDLDWTLATSPALSLKPSTKAFPEDERTTPGVRKTFELLICKDNRFENAFEKGKWGFAQRTHI
ncbi:class I SAM-dependent methyltransferase [Terriglobus albidus]|uniref:Class I SAM-dependent methyltransferase n=1 Tax=Terriglobus albidus TaxID=1592106 RepID=A0A5B9E9K5_9BACT|nr:class I SAM-dependent methyltransferase [Terriglobus albidus]QEE27300.1 class I SAM-dependent methyltransferase [Terriglobus albidus]